MIKLIVSRCKSDNSIVAFTCKGHAGFAKNPGEYDIVCAAVSGIVYTALGYMHEFYGLKDFLESDGFIKWSRPENLDIEAKHNINTVLEAMVVGIRQIEAKYRKHVRVLVEEV